MSVFLYQSTVTFAHGGRTDANGCHTVSSTGEYHCHGGSSSSSNNSSSSSSSSYVRTYKDHDRNGINDYEQNSSELANNIRSMGNKEGFDDAKYSNYQPYPTYDEFSNTELKWYQQGYEEGYNKKKLQILGGVAREEGYQSGFITDEKVIPEKYLVSEEVKESFNNGFEKAQKEKWNKYAKETALSLKPLNLPEKLPQTVQSSAKESYDYVLENQLQHVYARGYQFAFENETLNVPQEYKYLQSIEKEFTRGFRENIEINDYKKQAYKEGKRISGYEVPALVQSNGAEEIYRKYFNKGQEEQKQTIYKWLKLIGLPLLGIAIIIFFVFRSYWKRKTA